MDEVTKCPVCGNEPCTCAVETAPEAVVTTEEAPVETSAEEVVAE